MTILLRANFAIPWHLSPPPPLFVDLFVGPLYLCRLFVGNSFNLLTLLVFFRMFLSSVVRHIRGHQAWYCTREMLSDPGRGVTPNEKCP